MHSTIETWSDDLVDSVEDAQGSEAFEEWLDVQSWFHDYSYRNTLLIKQQCPGSSCVAGYRAWQEEFDRYVTEGESAIWIWAPTITKRSPKCENSQLYHEDSDCASDETPPHEWSNRLVGFKPRQYLTSPRPRASRFRSSIPQLMGTRATSLLD